MSGQPAARVGDRHTCPMVDPGPKPHVGGPILPPGAPTVLICGQPAARMGDMATCVGQVHPCWRNWVVWDFCLPEKKT